MLPSEWHVVAAVIDRFQRLQRRKLDALEQVEVVSELQEEFRAEPVRWAICLLVARGVARESRCVPAEKEPMWDRDLDG